MTTWTGSLSVWVVIEGKLGGLRAKAVLVMTRQLQSYELHH
jgi:hypothetical protein